MFLQLSFSEKFDRLLNIYLIIFMNFPTFNSSRLGTSHMLRPSRLLLIATVVSSVCLFLDKPSAQSDLLYLEQIKKDMPDYAKKFIQIKPTDYNEALESNGYMYIRNEGKNLFTLKKILDNTGNIYGWVLVNNDEEVWMLSDASVKFILFSKRL